MIKELIVCWLEEANEEAVHKGLCVRRSSQHEQMCKEKTEAVERLHTEIDELQASIAKLTEEISELTEAITDLDAALAKATTIRQEEKATNTETIKDVQDAQTEVAQALTISKEFYAKAGKATARLLQQPEAS